MVGYDAAGDERRSHYRIIVPLVFLVLGGIMLAAGLTQLKKTDMKKYFDSYSMQEDVAAADITELDIDLGAARVTIGRSDDEDIHIKADGIPYKLHQRAERKRLFIYSEDPELGISNIWFSVLNRDGFDGTIEILLPDKQYSYVDIDCGLCKLSIDGISCEKLVFDAGMADVGINALTCTGDAKFDMGMSDIEMKNCSLYSSDFDVGMGDLDFSGTITGETNIDVGMGDADLEIYGSRSDYHITTDGTVKVLGEGKNTVGGINIDIDSSLGDVTIEFRAR